MSKKENAVYEKPSSSRIQPCKKATKPEESSKKLSDLDLIYPDRMKSDEEMLEENRREWREWAELAIEHYARKEGGNFTLVDVDGLMQTMDVPHRDVHMNFFATNETQEQKLFYAELKIPCNERDPQLHIHVLGCSVLKEIDSGNPKARGCGMCGTYVRHPGPKDGFSIESGDGLEVFNLGL